MSEQQVLPQRIWTHEERLAAAMKIDEIIESQQFAVETIGNHGYTPGIIDIQCELTALRASLAQSSAELPRCEGETIVGAIRNLKQSVLLNEGNCQTLEAELARERELNQWNIIESTTALTADMEVGRWMGKKWVITRMEGSSDGWAYIQPNDFFTHYRMLNPPALLADKSKPVVTAEEQ